jgi:hypothetical protein
MGRMDQDILRPEPTPKSGTQAFSPLGCFLAAAGATLLTLTLCGAAAITSAWAFSKLMGFPDTIMLGIMALIAIPVLWATIWTGGRAWHVERRLAQHLDVDAPVYRLGYYFRKQA